MTQRNDATYIPFDTLTHKAPREGSESTGTPDYVLELRPMRDAPRDGTEILAYHKDGKNFHPIKWKTFSLTYGESAHWGMRWNDEYNTQDGFYDGWLPYPELNT